MSSNLATDSNNFTIESNDSVLNPILESLHISDQTNTNAAYEIPTRCVFIDLQGFADNNNSIIIKELAAVEIINYGGDSQHPFVKTLMWTTVKSPYKIGLLDRKRFRQYNYLRRHYHGLHWSEGTMSATTAFQLLENIICGGDYENDKIQIFVKGDQKAAYVASKMSGSSIEEYGGKTLRLMELPSYTPNCPYHSRNGYNNYVCSLFNAYKLAEYHRIAVKNDSNIRANVE